jgi:hypothetical protein
MKYLMKYLLDFSVESYCDRISGGDRTERAFNRGLNSLRDLKGEKAGNEVSA